MDKLIEEIAAIIGGYSGKNWYTPEQRRAALRREAEKIIRKVTTVHAERGEP